MTAWAWLVVAVAAEVAGTLSLRMAVHSGPRWYAVVVAGYVTAFVGLSTSLAHGMPLGVAYGTWAAAGVALTAIGSRVLFGEALTRRMTVGIALIMVGVLLLELGGGH